MRNDNLHELKSIGKWASKRKSFIDLEFSCAYHIEILIKGKPGWV